MILNPQTPDFCKILYAIVTIRDSLILPSNTTQDTAIKGDEIFMQISN